MSCCRLESTAKTRRAYLRTELRALGTPFVIDGRDVRIGVAIGRAFPVRQSCRSRASTARRRSQGMSRPAANPAALTVGIALAPPDGVTLDRLAACADAALYQAKHKGRGSVVIAGERPAASAPAIAA